MLMMATGLMSQTPPPPNGNGGNPTGGGNTPVGGGAPIAEGIFILTALGAGYGIRKFYKSRKQLAE